jgi:hypothetical protein
LNSLNFHWEVADPHGRVGNNPTAEKGTHKEKVKIIFRFSTNITMRVNMGGEGSTT